MAAPAANDCLGRRWWAEDSEDNADHQLNICKRRWTTTTTSEAKMTENLNKKPQRGILKQSTSFEQRELEPPTRQKNPHFDEQNILETLHPEDKDYGFMKIEEPKTPYEYAVEEDDDEEGLDDDAKNRDELDAQLLAERIASECSSRPRRVSEPSGDEEDLKLLSPEEREKRRQFEQKRKSHYNEFFAVKMARQLMEEEDDGDDDDDNNGEEEDANKKKKCPEAMDEASSSAV